MPLPNAFQTFARAPPPNTVFRVWEFVADPSIVDRYRASRTNVGLVLHGAPPKRFEVQTPTSLDVLPAAWASWAATGPMTNSFRLFPAFTPTEVKRFYRGKEL